MAQDESRAHMPGLAETADLTGSTPNLHIIPVDLNRLACCPPGFTARVHERSADSLCTGRKNAKNVGPLFAKRSQLLLTGPFGRPPASSSSK